MKRCSIIINFLYSLLLIKFVWVKILHWDWFICMKLLYNSNGLRNKSFAFLKLQNLLILYICGANWWFSRSDSFDLRQVFLFIILIFVFAISKCVIMLNLIVIINSLIILLYWLIFKNIIMFCLYHELRKMLTFKVI